MNAHLSAKETRIIDVEVEISEILDVVRGRLFKDFVRLRGFEYCSLTDEGKGIRGWYSDNRLYSDANIEFPTEQELETVKAWNIIQKYVK